MNRKPERLPPVPITDKDKKEFDEKKKKWEKVSKKPGCPILIVKIIKKFFGL